ncbi:MAG: hypothetical protein GC160_19865 [Acidobacteria bacterium]|nr:hypothetical protein [Acidobacteriota bacterium]
MMVRESYLTVCEGDHCAAALLAEAVYATDGCIAAGVEHGYFQRSIRRLSSLEEIEREHPSWTGGLMGLYGATKIRAALKYLGQPDSDNPAAIGLLFAKEADGLANNFGLLYRLDVDKLNARLAAISGGPPTDFDRPPHRKRNTPPSKNGGGSAQDTVYSRARERNREIEEGESVPLSSDTSELPADALEQIAALYPSAKNSVRAEIEFRLAVQECISRGVRPVDQFAEILAAAKLAAMVPQRERKFLKGLDHFIREGWRDDWRKILENYGVESKQEKAQWSLATVRHWADSPDRAKALEVLRRCAREVSGDVRVAAERAIDRIGRQSVTGGDMEGRCRQAA